jgi:hypothetical protein
VDGTDSGSCPIAAVGIIGVEPSGSASTLIWCRLLVQRS